MALIEASVTHTNSRPHVYGLLGVPRLLSYDHGILTIYRVDTHDSPFLIIDEWLKDNCPSMERIYARGEADKYGEVYLRIKSSKARYRQLCGYLNGRYLGINYPGNGVMAVHDDLSSVPAGATQLRFYKYAVGPTGFSLDSDKGQIIKGYITGRVIVSVNNYHSWDQSAFNNSYFTRDLGILESAHPLLEQKINETPPREENAILKLPSHEVRGIMANLIEAMQMPGLMAIPDTQETHLRYFYTYVP